MMDGLINTLARGLGKRPAPNGKAFDPSVLKEDYGLDEVAFVEVLEDFSITTRPILVAMADALRTENDRAMRDAGHKLKSSARTVGAHELADCCEAIQKAAEAKDWQRLRKLTAQAPRLFRSVESEIRSMI